MKEKGTDKICPHCHKPVEADSVYCEHCGTKISTGPESIKEHISRKTTSRKKFFKRISIFVGILLILSSVLFTFMLTHQWRWGYFYGAMNYYGVGAYGSDVSNYYGLYRDHWYGYEDLTHNSYFTRVVLNNDYIAALYQGEWEIYSADFEVKIDCGIDSLIVGDVNHKPVAEVKIDCGIDSLIVGENVREVFCKKYGLWGKLYIWNSNIVETETIPYLFEKKESLEQCSLKHGLSFKIKPNSMCYGIEKISSDAKVVYDDYPYQIFDESRLNVDFIYGDHAFFLNEGRWCCTLLSNLELYSQD